MRALVLAGVVLSVAACSVSPNAPATVIGNGSAGASGAPTDGGTGSTDGGTGSTDDEGGSSGGDDDGSPQFGGGDARLQKPKEDANCESIGEEAQAKVLPADIVVIIDNSGSMTDEAAAVQGQMNNFSAQIIAAGVDVHVALVSSYPKTIPGGSGNGMCIPPPLGATAPGCTAIGGDNNPPTFLHVNQRVGSNDALNLLMTTYTQYSSIFRPESSKHFIVITDDDSNMPADAFNSELQKLYPGARVHGAYCFTACNPIAANVGSVYQTLVPMTGGISVDFCLQDFKLVFDEVSKEVIGGAKLSCAYDIPPPPDKKAFDPKLTNMSYTPGGGTPEIIGYVKSLADCSSVGGQGWYFLPDEATATKVEACPDTCTKFQANLSGKVEIQFGCERHEAVPQ